MRKRGLRWLALAITVGLLAAACGSDRDDEAAVTTTAAPAPGATAAPTTTQAPGVKFGNLDSPCGKGDAKGATQQGVTDTSITIGYGDDRGYVGAPGLNKEMGEAMEALIAWCNEQGGINGRQIVGKLYDAKLLEIDPVITSACREVFMLVGQGFALDTAQEGKRIGCKLATVPGYSVSAAFAHGSGMVQSVANPSDQAPMHHAYALAQLFPEAIKKTGVMYANYAATIETKDKVIAPQGFPAAGYSFVPNCDQVYNIAGESDWKPFAEALKRCGAEIVYWTGSPAPNFQNYLTAAKQVGFEPKAYITDANFYDANFATWNGGPGAGAGDATYVRMAFIPFEEAATNAATKQYLDTMTKAGRQPSLLGAQSTASFLLWATAAKACGSTLTSKCILAEIAKLKDWTAGGLHTPMEPGKNQAPDCGILVKLTGDKYERVAPKDKPFDCDPKYRATGIKTKAIEDAKIGADRIATQFGTFTP
jgi:ABC-type branched-subunit amino acid transport system substrate-binding protein